MMPIDDLSPGTIDDDNAARRRLVADLDAFYAAAALAHMRTSLRATLRTQALAARRTPRHRAPLSRLGALTAAVIVAMGGLVGYLRVQAPTPVSAQAILQRAAATLTAAHPNEVVHDISRIYYGPNRAQDVSQDIYIQGPLTVTVDQWTQVDATGAISRQVTTATNQAGKLVFRALRRGQEVRTYGAQGPGRDWIVDVTQAIESRPTPFVNSGFLQLDLARLVGEARTGVASYIHLLPARTVAGTPVNVVEIGTSGSATILYIDAQTYAIRGVDEIESGQLNLRMRLPRHAIVSPAGIPAGTFALGAPAGVLILHPIPTTQLLDVVTAVAQSPGLVPVLGRDVSGLQLQAVERSRLVAHAHDIDYVYRTTPPDLVRLKQLAVSIVTGPDGPSVATATGRGSGQPLAGQPIAVTIMGRVVPAHYTAMGGSMGEFHTLTYQQGVKVVSLQGYRMTKVEFFTAVTALVDGKTHPRARARLQRELDQSLAMWHVVSNVRGS